MSVWRPIKEDLVRTVHTVVLLLRTLLLFALCILSTAGFDWLLGMVVDKETLVYQVAKMMTDVLLLGGGLVVTFGGIVDVIKEVRVSVTSSRSSAGSDAKNDS